MLVDLTDGVAEALNKPFQALSVEMIYRGLDHFTVAHHRGKAADPVAYLAADAKGLGILKRERKNRTAITKLYRPLSGADVRKVAGIGAVCSYTYHCMLRIHRLWLNSKRSSERPIHG